MPVALTAPTPAPDAVLRATIDLRATAEVGTGLGPVSPWVAVRNLTDETWVAGGFPPGEYTLFVDVPEGAPVVRPVELAGKELDLGALPVAEAGSLVVDVDVREPFVARSSQWVRAPRSGILRARAALGAAVKAGEPLGIVADPLGAEEEQILAPEAGVVIGRTELPLVNEGDALFHVATFRRPEEVAETWGEYQDALADADRV